MNGICATPKRLLAPSLLCGALLAAASLVGCADPEIGPDAGGRGQTIAGADTTTPPSGDTAGAQDTSSQADGGVGADLGLPPESDLLGLVRVTPETGLASGLEQVELVGTGFTDGLQVFFGESLAQDAFVLDSRRVVVLTPPRVPGLVDVRVVDPQSGAEAILEAGYLFYNPVQVTEVDSPTGHILGGEAVTLRGLGFRAESQVVFGRIAAVSVEVQSDDTILAVTPAGVELGAVNVYVSNDLGIGSFLKGYTYVDAPRIDAIEPPVGLVAGGNSIDIVGRGFHDPTTILVGGQALEDLEIINETRVRGSVPAATGAGSVAVMAVSPYGTATRLDGYTYLADLAPASTLSLLTITPPAGPASGGQTVTLVAQGLSAQASDHVVTFDDVAATVLSVDAPGRALRVRAPSGVVGAVDVVITNSNGMDTGSYTFEAVMSVAEVSPSHGPTEGGTEITITGEGFGSGAQVRVGALPATGVTVVDANTIVATTPPGSPGFATVTVIDSGLMASLPAAFAYDSELALWVVDPPQGSQAGGTEIALIGGGFPADARVKIGGRNATHVQVVSPTLIVCKSPPGELGTFAVSVVSDSGAEVTLQAAFTYFDPESSYGGTWGDAIEGDVNVSVKDSSNGAPIPDAFVMLWTDPNTPYQGFTNSQGQITFSGDDLLGEQMASASKEGYSSASVVEYDATNLTLYLNPTSPPSPGSPPSIEQPIYRGQVTNLGKSVPIPWGQCNLQGGSGAPLCNACEQGAVDGESGFCGAGYHCNELPGQGTFCTQDCATDAGCPAGYICYPLNGQEVHQCVPSAGEVTAFCDFSNGSIFAQDLLPDPGIEANADLSFTIPIPLGEFAVYCWGGIINRQTNVFTPYALGVDRHVLANPGDQIEGEIRLEHPLNKTYTVRLDDIPRGPDGPDINILWRYLDLGSDGVITFLDQVDSWMDAPFTLTHFLGGLTGNLYDASFTFMGGAFSLTDTYMPYSMTLHQNIKTLEDDTMFYLEDGEWLLRRTGVTKNVNAMWAVGAGDIVGVGSQGSIIRSLGTSWAGQNSTVSADLNGVHGDGAGTLIAVGDDGTAIHWDGFQWEAKAMSVTNDMHDVYVAGASDAFAVGYYAVQRWDGTAWSAMGGNTSRYLNGVWGFGSDDVWAVGNYGQIIHWDGSVWSSLYAGNSQNLRDVWGPAPDDLYMVGEGGTVLHWDGAELLPMAIESTATLSATLSAIWGDAADNIYIVGSKGTVFHYDGIQWARVHLPGDSSSSNFLAIGGDAGKPIISGGHELLLGPILAVPEDISPGEGEVMDEDYSISWSNLEGVPPHFSLIEVAIPGMFGPVPEWNTVNDWDVQELHLPHFPSIEGTPGISAGSKILTIFRVYKEGFDIDNYSNQDMGQSRWRSWSVNQLTFQKN